MEKLAQDLKKRFLNMVEAIKGCKTARGNEKGQEPELEFGEKLSVQDRAIRVKIAKGPKRPGVPKGPPAQTS